MRKGIDAIRDQIYRVTPSWFDEPLVCPPETTEPEIVRFEAEICGGCGGPCGVTYYSDGRRQVESHADGTMGSDVPCGW